MTTAQDQQSRAEADQWKCGNEFLPYHPSASHVEPAYRDGWNACFKAAAQVQAMGRVPACPYPCGWDGLHKIAVADGAYLARIEWPEDEDGVSVQRAAAMRTVTNLIDVCRAMLSANQKAPTT